MIVRKSKNKKKRKGETLKTRKTIIKIKNN